MIKRFNRELKIDLIWGYISKIWPQIHKYRYWIFISLILIFILFISIIGVVIFFIFKIFSNFILMVNIQSLNQLINEQAISEVVRNESNAIYEWLISVLPSSYHQFIPKPQ